MKKLFIAIVAVAVALTFALTVYAGKTKVKVKEETKGDTTTVKATEKSPEGKETIRATTSPAGTNIIDVTKHKHGDLWKDTVKFKSYKEGDDHVYLLKEDKVYRVKFRKSAKSSLMKLKKGEPVKIVSTHPLSGPEIAEYVMLHEISSAK